MGFGGFICRWICPCGFQNLSVLLGSGCWNVVVAVAVVAAVYVVITAFDVREYLAVQNKVYIFGWRSGEEEKEEPYLNWFSPF